MLNKEHEQAHAPTLLDHAIYGSFYKKKGGFSQVPLVKKNKVLTTKLNLSYFVLCISCCLRVGEI